MYEANEIRCYLQSCCADMATDDPEVDADKLYEDDDYMVDLLGTFIGMGEKADENLRMLANNYGDIDITILAQKCLKKRGLI